MLVMSRRAGETILIGEDIEIVIAQIGRRRVKVGIRAPRELPVMAREMKLVEEENAAAAGTPQSALPELLARLATRPQISAACADMEIIRQDAGTED
jgi:carbon storage regulator